MGRPRVFIDGQAGTTGLRIREWLRGREDLDQVEIGEAERKNPAARRRCLNEADLAVLCLPDAAAREVPSWIENPSTRLIDASTAHRLGGGWTYGLPELAPGQRDAIRAAKRVAHAGCYASAVILALRPLCDAGLLPPDATLAIHALSGYSGGGRELCERWEDPRLGLLALPYPAPYALERIHKHMPEIVEYTPLLRSPQFVPAVGPFHHGMRVEIPLPAGTLASGADGKAVWEALERRYRGERFVRVWPYSDPVDVDELSFDPRRCNGTNRLELAVAPNPAGHLLLVVLLDNLGKGAAGVAIQSLNLMLGLPEERGLPV
jgi:N-acetyl-gamma-glutamyl-phosphate reductase